MSISHLRAKDRLRRREFALCLGSTVALTAFHGSSSWSRAAVNASVVTFPASLLYAPIELAGDWGQMLPRAVDLVLERARQACLEDVRLLSDRQPDRLRVDEHSSGPPAIWLHPDGTSLAWIIVDIGERDWSKLAYQFGHELGHVLANSWQADAKPAPPCQWLEEAMVEAFSLRGLGRLALGWKQNPPFAGDNAFGDAIGAYRDNILRDYSALADSQGLTRDTAAWFATNRSAIEAGGLIPYGQAMAHAVLAEYEARPECVEALGALNRWPGRTGIAIRDYLARWEESCAELGASPRLPMRLRALFGIR
jgi:hypothetical protein